MEDTRKPKNISLIIGLLIPVLMILFVAASIYLPGLFIEPEYDFVYVVHDAYNREYRYFVEGGTITRAQAPANERPIPVDGKQIELDEGRLYLHDVSEDMSRELTFEEAQELRLVPGLRSPDGFEVACGSRGSGFFFFDGGRDCSKRYLRNKGASMQVNVVTGYPNYYYDGNLGVVGWVVEQ